MSQATADKTSFFSCKAAHHLGDLLRQFFFLVQEPVPAMPLVACPIFLLACLVTVYNFNALAVEPIALLSPSASHVCNRQPAVSACKIGYHVYKANAWLRATIRKCRSCRLATACGSGFEPTNCVVRYAVGYLARVRHRHIHMLTPRANWCMLWTLSSCVHKHCVLLRVNKS